MWTIPILLATASVATAAVVSIPAGDPSVAVPVSAAESNGGAPVRLFLHTAGPTSDAGWFLSSDTQSGESSRTIGSPLLPAVDALTVGSLHRHWVDASGGLSMAQAFAGEFVLHVASNVARTVDVRADLYLNHQYAASGEESVLLWPSVSGVDMEWSDVHIPLLFEAGAQNVGVAKVVLSWETPPGADWYVRTDGTSGLVLLP